MRQRRLENLSAFYSFIHLRFSLAFKINVIKNGDENQYHIW
ncbi:MAG: hypothetical protein [Chaetfec virus UA24_244]|nr:MAG: hypothetical protein [Chaetfec virus UA24_244]